MRKMKHAYNKDNARLIILKQKSKGDISISQYNCPAERTSWHFSNFILKCCHDLCAMWQIMHRVHLQYLYQYMTKFKSAFFCEIIRQI